MDQSNWIPGTRYFTQITNDDHTGWLYIITLLSLIYVSLAFIVRFIVKYGAYGWDDWTLLGATLVAIGQYITMLSGCANGLGKSITLLSAHQIAVVERYAAAHVFLFVIAHCLAKVSTALLALRLFATGHGRNSLLCWGLVVASVLYGLCSILALASGCSNPTFPVGANDSCPNRHARWQAILGADIVSEALLGTVPSVLLMHIRIKPAAKVMVMSIFAVRLLDIAFAVINITRIDRTDSDYGLAIVPSLIWTQTELLWSLISASLPCLRAVMRPFDKIDEETWRSNNPFSSQLSGRSWRDRGDGSVPLEDVKGHNKGVVLSGSDRRAEKVGHNVEISHPAKGTDLRRSWGSQEHIIKTQTQWEVRHEPWPPNPREIRE